MEANEEEKDKRQKKNKTFFLDLANIFAANK